MFSFLALGLVGAPAFAADSVIDGPTIDPKVFNVNKPAQYFGKNADVGFESLGVGKFKDPRDLAKNIINIILGFLGIVAVIIILMAGFQWMTAGGEEEKVTEARQRLIQGAIGLVLIIAAWVIAYFVIDQLVRATSS